MSISFSLSANQLFDPLKKSIQRSVTKGLDNSSQFMAKQFDLVFENQGFKNVNARGFGFELFEPTTFAAKKARKTYPTGGGKLGKKGFTQAQARYLFAAPSLEDTGKMRSSIAIEEDNNDRYIGVGVPYIKLHEEGGIVSVNGKSYDVPARPFQHITSEEQKEIEDIIRRSF